MSIARLRSAYHREICRQILFVKKGAPNIADVSSKANVAISLEMVKRLNQDLARKAPPGQTAGARFEVITRDFLEASFRLLHHLRPGKWVFSVARSIAEFEQYEHLANLERMLHENPELRTALGGDYLVTPDIVVGRHPVTDEEINRLTTVVGGPQPFCQFAPLRAANRPPSCRILHASISCKWTIRSDRAQNVRTEALNLIRNRKGQTPHVGVVTAEPLPTRLASLALGTGDLDCVYHFALPELGEAVETVGNEDQLEMLQEMINGRRVRDISDLPLDLAI
jgi:hypothetical protein